MCHLEMRCRLDRLDFPASLGCSWTAQPIAWSVVGGGRGTCHSWGSFPNFLRAGHPRGRKEIIDCIAVSIVVTHGLLVGIDVSLRGLIAGHDVLCLLYLVFRFCEGIVGDWLKISVFRTHDLHRRMTSLSGKIKTIVSCCRSCEL